MNKFKEIDSVYLRPSRTIETILVSNSISEKIFYIYNYEGNSYRVFENILNILEFFDGKFEPKIHFEKEYELEYFLKNYKIRY